MNDYHQFLALKRNGFQPPMGPGRCKWCACHIRTQGHRRGCPKGGS